MLKKSAILLVLFLISSFAFAQDKPFQFTTTLPEQNTRALLFLDAGWGPSTNNASAHRNFGLEWRFNPRWSVSTNANVMEADSSTVFTGQAEIFYSFQQNSQRRFHLDLGSGMRFESQNHAVALFHVLSGWQTDSWLLQSNVLFEKANAPNRDPFDLIVSVGWMRHISSQFSVGVETIGQDLEGFWEQEEAEGGSRLLVGPSVHFDMGAWEAGVAGGYVFRPTFNRLNSSADRPLGSNRTAIQFSICRVL